MKNLIVDIVLGTMLGFIPSRSKASLAATIVITVLALALSTAALIGGTSL
jgi:hypothetical protein